MAISVRLDEMTEHELEQLAAASGLSKSDLIRQCLTEFLAKQAARSRAWELGVDLFGKAGSGRPDLSENRKRIVREKIHAGKNRG